MGDDVDYTDHGASAWLQLEKQRTDILRSLLQEQFPLQEHFGK